MNKIELVLIALVLPILMLSQNRLDSYTASNGIEYKVGDKIQLDIGSGCDGKFVYVSVGGIMITMDAETNMLPATSAGMIMRIKKIKHYRTEVFNKVMFIMGINSVTNYNMDIEYALRVGEVHPNVYIESESNLDSGTFLTKEIELDALKEQLDAEEISKAEYFDKKRAVILKYKD